MPLVEGIRGPDPVRYCGICETHTLQLVASYVGYDDDGNVTREPVTFSHLGPHCPVCTDKIRTGELVLDGDSARDGVDGVRREPAAA